MANTKTSNLKTKDKDISQKTKKKYPLKGLHNQIPDTTRTLMFEVWSENQSIKYVSKICGVSLETVRKYRAKDQWDRKLELLSSQLLKPQVADIQKVKDAKIMELVAVAKIAKAAALRLPYKDPKDAARIYLQCVDKEMELRGEKPAETVNIIVLAQERFQKQRQTKELPDNEVKVEDV